MSSEIELTVELKALQNITIAPNIPNAHVNSGSCALAHHAVLKIHANTTIQKCRHFYDKLQHDVIL